MDSEEAIVERLTREFPLVDPGLLYGIYLDSVQEHADAQAAEKACRDTLEVLSLETEFQTSGWKDQDIKDLEDALKDVGEEFSAITFEDGNLKFKAADENINLMETFSDDEPEEQLEPQVKEEPTPKKKNRHKIAREERKARRKEQAEIPPPTPPAPTRQLTKKERMEQAKISQLCAMFSNISEHNIRVTLEGQQWDIERATEELLSFEVIKESREVEELDKHLEKLQLKNNPLKAPKDKSIEEMKSFLSKDLEYLESIYKLSSEEAFERMRANEFNLTKTIIVLDEERAPNWQTLSTTVKVPSPVKTYAAMAGSSEATSPRMVRTKMTQKEIEEKVRFADSKHTEEILKAQQAYRKSKSNHMLRSLAGIYAENAQQYNAEKHAALDAHFTNVVDHQTSSHCIDLHGLPLAHAIKATHEKLHNWWTAEQNRIQNSAGRAKPVSLKIISGAGSHSNANIPKIKNGVRKKLVKEKWRFTEHSSYFVVAGVL